MFGYAFYRPFKYKIVTHARVFVLEPKFKITENQGLFLTNSLNFIHTKFGYENMCSWVKIQSEKIQLPTKNKEIDFAFMESFIADLEVERIVEMKAYLFVSGLKDYILTKEEEKILMDFERGNFEWGEFKIEDVLVWQQKITELNPLHLDSLSITNEKKYPFYGQSTINNGIIEYRYLNPEVLNNKKGKPTILVHSNNQNTVYLENPFYLKDGHGATSVLQSDYLNKLTAQFLISSIKKVILNKYSYNKKATKIELKKTVIKLPIKAKQPDYHKMETFISAIQKLVIKDVVLYADNKITMTKK